MSKVDESAIGDILDAIVGTTSPQADSTMDEESQRNIPMFEAVCDWVFDRLLTADMYIESPYTSARTTARMVEAAAGDLALTFTRAREGGDRS